MLVTLGVTDLKSCNGAIHHMLLATHAGEAEFWDHRKMGDHTDLRQNRQRLETELLEQQYPMPLWN